MDNFASKTAVVTGAASGIGFELAKIFAEQGMKVVMADIEEARLEPALAQIQALGTEAIAVVTDVSKAESVENLAQQALQAFGAIHIVCNNAGVYTGGHLWEATLADYQWLMDVNQWGIIHGIRSFVPKMIAQGDECHIVNTASMAAMTTLPFAGIYHMTKHAALALSECLYHELNMTNPQVGVSCLCPELIDTGIAQSERNRPQQLADINETDMRNMAHTAITDATRGSLSPRVMAERVLEGIKNKQFYLMPEKNNPWRDTAEVRLEDILQNRNPSFAPPEI